MRMFRRLVLAIFLCGSFQVLRVRGDCSVHPIVTSLDYCTAQAHGIVNTTAESWGIGINIRNQELCVTPSTVTNDTFLPSIDACANDPNTSLAACISRRGGLLVPDSQLSFLDAGPNDQIFLDNPNWKDIQVTGRTMVGNVTLRFPQDNTLINFPVGIIAGGQNHSNGHLGLAQKSVFLQSLVDRNLIPTPSFGLYAGSQYRNQSGRAVFGGYDRQAIGGPFLDFPISSERVANRWCPLQVQIKKFELVFADGRTGPPLIDAGVTMRACIEPYDNLFRFPSTVLSSLTNLMTASGWRNNTHFDDQDFLVTEPGLYFDSAMESPFNGSFRLTLGNSSDTNDITFTIPHEELTRPVRGLVRNGTRQVNTSVTELAVFNKPGLFDAAVLGKAFLSRVYLTVLYHENKFQLARLSNAAITGTPSAPDIVAFTCTSSPPVRGTKRKTIIGASVGGAIGGIVLAVSGYLFWITFRPKPKPAPLPTTKPQTQPQPDTQQPTQ